MKSKQAQFEAEDPFEKFNKPILIFVDPILDKGNL